MLSGSFTEEEIAGVRKGVGISLGLGSFFSIMFQNLVTDDILVFGHLLHEFEGHVDSALHPTL